jgi:hypothetical protein
MHGWPLTGALLQALLYDNQDNLMTNDNSRIRKPARMLADMKQMKSHFGTTFSSPATGRKGFKIRNGFVNRSAQDWNIIHVISKNATSGIEPARFPLSFPMARMIKSGIVTHMRSFSTVIGCYQDFP